MWRGSAIAIAIFTAGCGREGPSDATVMTGATGTTGALNDGGSASGSWIAGTTISGSDSADAGISAASGITISGSEAGSTASESAAAIEGPAWAKSLAPILFRDVNTLADVSLRLYRIDGSIDEEAAAEVDRVLWSAKDDVAPHVSRRLLQLVVKVAAHFEAHEVQVISSHRGRARKGSRHRSGEAIDFVLSGVPPKKVAETLRTYARVGVGLYVHPRSQFVHLDVRDQSYHWVDGSPPGRTWREQALPDPTAPARDAAYAPDQDLPM